MLNKIISEEKISQLKQLIDDSHNIVMITHVSPDGDALGSSLSLYWLLHDMGKNASVVVPNRFPEFLAWLPGSKDIVIALDDNDRANKTIAEADLLCLLDFNTINRINWLKTPVGASKARRILIDHHPNPDIECDVEISHPEISSTAELMYRIVSMAGTPYDHITKDIAECIYTGMMTDTGGFTYNSTRPEIYFVIGQLLSKGIDKDNIYNRVYHNYSVNALRLRGHIIAYMMKVVNELHAAYFRVTID